MKRREFLQAAGALSVAGCAGVGGSGKPRVLGIGAGFGGATVAKYVRMWDPDINVMLVDRGTQFVSCPVSNLVLGGNRTMADITRGYDGLRQHGVPVVNGNAVEIDPAKKRVTLVWGRVLIDVRVGVAPRVECLDTEVEGFSGQDRILDA